VADLLVLDGEGKRRRVSPWKMLGAAGSVLAAFLAFAFTQGWLALGFEGSAHAAATYETKVDADKAHLRLQSQIDYVFEEHRDEAREQRQKLENIRANVERLLGRMGVQPVPEDPE
jgi:hypothetical protein